MVHDVVHRGNILQSSGRDRGPKRGARSGRRQIESGSPSLRRRMEIRTMTDNQSLNANGFCCIA